MCGQPLVKPATVLYGRGLPEAFFDAVRTDLGQPADDHEDLVLIVAGSSLTVSPANQVPTLVGPAGTRIVVDRNPKGLLPPRQRGSGGGGSGGGGGGAATVGQDLLLAGDCDRVFAQLAEVCGWGDALSALRGGGEVPSAVEETASLKALRKRLVETEARAKSCSARALEMETERYATDAERVKGEAAMLNMGAEANRAEAEAEQLRAQIVDNMREQVLLEDAFE